MFLLQPTRLRKKLLTYAFTHPEATYYVREFAGLIEEDPGNLSRELKNLEKEGLYISLEKGGQKIYRLNKKYHLYNELKKIIFKTYGIEGTLRNLVQNVKGIKKAFIYGSYAKQKEKSSSDIDLLVIGDQEQKELIGKINAIEAELNREINFNSYTEKEFVEEKNKKGGFLELVLKDKLIVLKGELNA